MTVSAINSDRIRSAWAGRVSGCMLGKPLEVLSFQQGRQGIQRYLDAARSLPLRDYVPLVEGSLVAQLAPDCCKGQMERAVPDDDINYTVLALLLLEDKGIEFDTADVARTWLRLLPAGVTWTAERSAYRTLLDEMNDEFVNGDEPGFDLGECSDNAYNDWIGAQIRTDLYGWVCPGRPALAAALAARDAALSHRGDGICGAVFVAALAAAIPVNASLDDAIGVALGFLRDDGGAPAAVRFGQELANSHDAVDHLHERYADLPPVHTLNNLALVVWALCSAQGDFSAAIGNAVSAGWDTDCNGATVGGLFGLSCGEIPEAWTSPWRGRIGVGLAGYSEFDIDDVTARTVAIAERIQELRPQ